MVFFFSQIFFSYIFFLKIAQNRKDFTTLEILPILLNIALSSDNLSLNRSLSAAIANLLHECKKKTKTINFKN